MPISIRSRRSLAMPMAEVAPLLAWWREPESRDLIIAGVYALGYLIVRALWVGTVEGRNVVLSLYYAPVYIVAGLLAWVAARRMGPEHRPMRRAWTCFAIGAFLMAASDNAWLYYELVLHTEDAPLWPDLIEILAIPFMLAGFLFLPAAPNRGGARARFWLDLATVIVGGTMVSWYIVLRPQMLAGHHGLGDLLLSLTFPVGDLVQVVAVAAVLVRAAAPGPGLSLRLLGASLVFGFTGDLIYGHMRLAGTYRAGDLVDWLWVLDGTCFALAARVVTPVKGREHRTGDPSGIRGPILLPYLSVAAGFTLLLWVAPSPVTSDLGRIAVGAFILTGLVVVRQMLAARDNLRLLAERAAQEARFRHEALHDSLTALANRALLRDRTAHAMTRARRTPHAPLALVFLDLDSFKTVNDSMGHAAGDALLVETARRLIACVRAGDTVARLGGDEFAILVEDAADEIECALVTDRIVAALGRPFVIDGRDVFVSASVGIATVSDGDAADDLLRNADVAMYHAKTRGKNQCVRFVPEMRASVDERVEVEADLRRAIEAREFVLYYQPIVILATGEITAVEALIRWQHPTRGLLAPAQFIRIAEETGLIVPIGAWALLEACRQAVAWRNRTFPEGVMAGSLAVTVNVSGRQLQTSRIVADVRAALASTGLPPHALIVELTESVLTEQTEPVIATVLAIKALGIRLAIDDFGTGYASLSYLQRFPIDILKIAKPFVDDVAAETGRHGLAQAIVTLGSTLGVRTIAEGIEQHAQSERLRELGCELGQGFHYAHPLPAAELERQLANAPSRPRSHVPRVSRVRNVGVL